MLVLHSPNPSSKAYHHDPGVPAHSINMAATKAQQLAEATQRVREAFIVFEHRDNSKMVDSREIPTIMRSLGINPTTPQLQSLQQAITAAAAESGGAVPAPAPSSSSVVSYVALEQCESLITTWMLEMKDSLARDDFHVLMRAFQALDPDGRGWLDAGQLKGLLTVCEDALTADEANAMIDAAADSQGRLYYQEYALRLATDARGV